MFAITGANHITTIPAFGFIKTSWFRNDLWTIKISVRFTLFTNGCNRHFICSECICYYRISTNWTVILDSIFGTIIYILISCFLITIVWSFWFILWSSFLFFFRIFSICVLSSIFLCLIYANSWGVKGSLTPRQTSTKFFCAFVSGLVFPHQVLYRKQGASEWVPFLFQKVLLLTFTIK